MVIGFKNQPMGFGEPDGELSYFFRAQADDETSVVHVVCPLSFGASPDFFLDNRGEYQGKAPGVNFVKEFSARGGKFKVEYAAEDGCVGVYIRAMGCHVVCILTHSGSFLPSSICNITPGSPVSQSSCLMDGASSGGNAGPLDNHVGGGVAGGEGVVVGKDNGFGAAVAEGGLVAAADDGEGVGDVGENAIRTLEEGCQREPSMGSQRCCSKCFRLQ